MIGKVLHISGIYLISIVVFVEFARVEKILKQRVDKLNNGNNAICATQVILQDSYSKYNTV